MPRERAEKAWLEEVRLYADTGRWVARDRNGRAVTVEIVLVSSQTAEADWHRVILRDKADILAVSDWELVTTHKILFCNPLIACIGLRVLFGEDYKDVLYSRMLEEYHTIISGGYDGLFYAVTVSELQEDDEVLLGSVSFSVKRDFPYGTVERTGMAVKPQARGRGIGKILASAIFKLLPQTERVILDVACTNRGAIAFDEACGFVLYDRDVDCCSCCCPCALSLYTYDYEYLASENRTLQDVAAMFEELVEDDD